MTNTWEPAGPYPHRIALRGPWDYEIVSGAITADAPRHGRMASPCRWQTGGSSSTVRLRRRFGYPGRIDAHERVWLLIGGLEGVADVSLNQCSLGQLRQEDSPFAFDVTPSLQARNQLQAEVRTAGDQGGFWDVALEVRCLAFPRRLSYRFVEIEGQAVLEVHGEIVGPSDLSLELYALLDRATVAYAPVQAVDTGRPFLLRSEPLTGIDQAKNGPGLLTVDLVRAGSSWYTVTTRVAHGC
ncbi:MAG: hypothetical protein ACK4RK_19155 [Gemmataceae bacterium]